MTTDSTSIHGTSSLAPWRERGGAFVLALVMLGTAGLLLRDRSASQAALSPEVEPLPEPAASCPEDSGHALHAARAALHGGDARLQRYLFAPRDGRRALARYAEAIECARLAGDEALLATASSRRADLHTRLERDIREHAQRYALLRQHGRAREAADSIAYLTDLGWPERGALAEQLRADREELETQAVEKKR